ncbi:hypothetical protein I3842_07G074300 [Carya illinoinensis]|uniref:Uncharacterized protein n=1 Tax=Carya illinoinensis TaxID=32201 RepID=A0A922EGG8_CARIL|nr:hypothetical protein I3842_07G074300 [Carya illinoinensis]
MRRLGAAMARGELWVWFHLGMGEDLFWGRVLFSINETQRFIQCVSFSNEIQFFICLQRNPLKEDCNKNNSSHVYATKHLPDSSQNHLLRRLTSPAAQPTNRIMKTKEGSSYPESKPVDLLHQFEHILEADPLIDEVGFIHPSQFAKLTEEADDATDIPTSECPSFWNRDHKFGVSTLVLLPLYNAAKLAFMAAIGEYKRLGPDVVVSGDGLESEVMKHSRALLLLSPDFGTAWNSRKLIVSKKQDLSIFMDELLLSELVLSYSPKSDHAWSHRRWVIKSVTGKCSTLQEILRKESELVEKIAERSKMNYRAWNHRCWLVSYMTRERVLQELKKSKNWAGLHVADNCCFHYRRLMLRILKDSSCKQENASAGYAIEIYKLWKEELHWNETLIKQYIGREALWLHRRFLSLCWMKQFVTDVNDVSCNSEQKISISNDFGFFISNELQLLHSCSSVPNSDFDDFKAQATFSASYMLWLTKQSSEFLSKDSEHQEKLTAGNLKTLLSKVCPERSSLWDSLMG